MVRFVFLFVCGAGGGGGQESLFWWLLANFPRFVPISECSTWNICTFCPDWRIITNAYRRYTMDMANISQSIVRDLYSRASGASEAGSIVVNCGWRWIVVALSVVLVCCPPEFLPVSASGGGVARHGFTVGWTSFLCVPGLPPAALPPPSPPARLRGRAGLIDY